MALPDFLWACPECGEDRGLEPRRRAHRCAACGTRYRRGRGASIVALGPDGSRVVRTPAEWLDRLPAPRTLLDRPGTPGAPIRTARVSTRWVTGSETVRGEDGFLNRIELWGDPSPGSLDLRSDHLVYSPDDEPAMHWPLESLTAVQASSRSLQVNRTGAPLVAFRFQDDSIFLWEQLLHEALRDFYGRTGRGEIVEFQPRIATA